MFGLKSNSDFSQLIGSTILQYTSSQSANATETIDLSPNLNNALLASIIGTVTANDTITLNVTDIGLTNNKESVTYTVVSGDTLNSITTNLVTAINNDTNLQAIGVTATSINNVININSKSINSTTYSSSTNSNATETLSLGLTTRLDQSIYNNLNQLVNLNSGGSLRFGGNTSKAMKSVNIASPVVCILANSNNSILAQTTYLATATTSLGITSPTMWLDMPQASNGITTATINGNSVTANTVMSITVNNSNLANGQETVSYTVTSSDTFTTIATTLTNQLNADTKLVAIGFVATTSSATINLSINQPIYSASLSTGATETATFGYNNLGNTQLTIGGKPTSGDVITIKVTDAYLTSGQASVSYTVQVSDTLTSIATGITNAINTSSALSAIGITGSNNTNVTFTGQNFNTSLPITSGATSVNITGLDAANNQVSNNTQILSIGRSNANTSFDLNGNMINDGTNTYQYDAEDRLVQINYPGTGNNTQIFYDGLGHWVKAIETINNATTSVIQYLWNGNNLIEERDGSGNVLRRFFNLGEQINGTNYYYVKDHLGSIRQMTDNSGNIVYQADYDAYGRATVTINTVTPAFGYAGYYVHGRSGLNLTVHRAYSSSFGRWLNRDPIGEAGGINLYGYVGGNPVSLIDPLGLQLLKGGISIDVPYPTPSPLPPGGGKCTGSPGGSGGGGSGGSGGGGGTGIGGLPGFGSAGHPMQPFHDQALPDPFVDGIITGIIFGFSQVAISGLKATYTVGREYSVGKNLRIAPFGNRTGHPLGELPHYHRRSSLTPRAGQGLKRHCLWQSTKFDKSFWDRF